MADSGVCSDDSAHTISKNKGNISESDCKRCSEYETQLKEVLEELDSAWTIIEILQNELLTSTTAKNAHGNGPVSTEGFKKQVNTKEWTVVTS
jgi:hypothetical protein